MIRTLPAAPGRRVYLALPIHSGAGVETPRMGGIFDAVLGIGGSLVSSIFGNKSQSDQLKAQRNIANRAIATPSSCVMSGKCRRRLRASRTRRNHGYCSR